MHFGGPLGTPAGPSLSSPMAQQTPFMPMNGLGMQLQEYQMNVSIAMSRLTALTPDSHDSCPDHVAVDEPKHHDGQLWTSSCCGCRGRRQ